MSDATTSFYGWAYPTVGGDAETWGTTIDAAIQAIDAQMHANAVAAQPSNAKLSSLSSVAGTANGIPYFSALNTFGLLTMGAGISIVGGALTPAVASVAGKTGAVTLAKADISGLGTSAGNNHTVSASAPTGTPADGDVWDQI